jgi:hypothetical protein
MSTSAPFISGLGGAASVVSSNTGNQAFPTIPIEDDPTPPNTNSLALISDLADFLKPLPSLDASTQDPAAVAAQYGQDVDFDWTTGEPTGLTSGNLSYVSGENQVVQWIQKDIYTPQGVYPIYDVAYGSILNQIRGEGGPRQTLYSEIARTSSECMSGHPRVLEAYIDAVTQNGVISPTAVIINARIYLDTSDAPIVATFTTS